MGSSITSKLYGSSKSLHNATLALSPPESTLTFFDTSSFENIDDAVVTIKDVNGNVIEVLNHVVNGFYKGQVLPEENTTYILEVNHPNYADITASDSLPSPIIINSVDTSTILDPINGNRLRISMNLSLIHI